MILTAHWSASGPHRINDYHVEFALHTALPAGLNDKLGTINDPKQVDWATLRAHFQVWKNTNFDTATEYGTWHLNHDPRDNSANVEVGALCMGGERVTVPGPWGAYPYTYAHAWMHAGIMARICHLKKIDPQGSFTASNMQNGPLFNVSTHAERAIQTPDPDANLRPGFGYFIYSGDPDSRWDISVRDVKEAPKLKDPKVAHDLAIQNAKWFRTACAAIIKGGITDNWGLDAGV